MKIAFAIDALAAGGGVEGYLRRAAAYLGEHGDEVELVVGRGSPAGPWRVRSLDVRGVGAGARLRRFAAAFDELLRAGTWASSLAIRHVRAAHVYMPHGGLVLPAAEARDERLAPPRRWLRQRYRACSPRLRAMRSLEAEALQRSGLVLALSERVRAEIAAVSPAALARTELLPLGVDLKRFTPEGPRLDWTNELALPRATPVVLFAAYNARLKGFAEAARALACSRALDAVHLAVVGPPAPPPLPRDVRAALRGRVHCLGPRADLPALYRGAAALLHPTWYDPCSTVALEALACGCPVVTTERNGAAELRGEALRAVADPRDAHALADALSQVLARSAILRAPAREAVLARGEREHFAALRHALQRVASAPPLP
ncbi:MAG: glycosyltransferase family 4 protein [Planctomycetes bacterium]|nr:glycosyltransferase family 4 protein [Planctomycetota bacterium]